MFLDVGLGVILTHFLALAQSTLATIVLAASKLLPIDETNRRKLVFFLLYGWQQPLLRVIGFVYQHFLLSTDSVPSHIAIVMDGNRRFARSIGIDSVKAGHEQGAMRVREFLDWCLLFPELREVTVWALSTDNLKGRNPREIADLWDLCVEHLPEWTSSDNQQALQDKGIKVRVVGERQLLPQRIQKIVEDLEAKTDVERPRLVFNVALAYGGKEEIVSAAKLRGIDLISEGLYTLSEPDLIIRSGAESRLSGFMMWQSAHSELHFSSQLWPAFSKTHFFAAIYDFQRRKRRFGR